MAVFYTNEFASVIPEEFRDRTVNVFTLTDEGPTDLSVVVTRDKLREGEDLATYLDRQLAILQQRMPQFRLRRREPAVVAAAGGERLEMQWQTPQGTVYTRQVAVVSPQGPVLTMSATFRSPPAEPYASMFEQFVASVRFHAAQGAS
jgi:hypothetical protein